VELPEGIDIFLGLCVLPCIAWVDVCYCCFSKAVNRQQKITMFWLHQADISAKREVGKEARYTVGYPPISPKRDWLTHTDSITSCYLCSWSSIHLVVHWEISDSGKSGQIGLMCQFYTIDFSVLFSIYCILTVGSKLCNT